MAKEDTRLDPSLARTREELDTLHAALEREIKRDRRGRYLFVVTVLLVTGVVFAYMWWLHSEVKSTLTPRSVSEVVERYTRDLLPDLGDELKRSLKSAAPDVARELRTRFLNDVLPELRGLGEEQLLTMVGGAIEIAEKQLAGTVGTVIREHKAEIRQHAESESAVGPNPLAQELEKSLQQELKRRLSDEPSEPLYAQLEKSRAQLRTIDDKLRDLARKKDLTRVESLEKRLITSWMVLVDERMKEADEQTPPAPGGPTSPTAGPAGGTPAPAE